MEKNGNLYKQLSECKDKPLAHIYVLDINAITDDAFARNKTFLDILKKV